LRSWRIVALAGGSAATILQLRKAPRSAQAGATASAAAAGECATNRDCSGRHGGAPWICRKEPAADLRRCVALESEDCKVLGDREDVENDATLWFGTMYPTTGPRASYGIVAERGADLGRRDFMQIAHGLPSLRWDGPVRPVGLVVCNDANDAARAAHHLVDDVGVPAVIGVVPSQEIVDLATKIFVPNHVLVATESRSPLIGSIPHPPGENRLIFRTYLTESVMAIPVSLLVSDVIEPNLAKAGVTGASTPVRVALIRPDSTGALSAADHVFAKLRFNGKSALENGDSYRQFVFKDPDHASEAVAALVAFRPHVVIYLGGSEIIRPVLEPIEKTWEPAAKVRPLYVSNTGLYGSDWAEFIGRNAERRRRFFGIAPPSVTLANARMTMRYNEVFPDPITPDRSPASYDAFYMLAYAAIASAGRSGPELAAGVGRLTPPGQQIDVGPTQILQGVEALRTAGRFDLAGIMTRLDFDLTTGESTGDLVITCFGVDATGMATDSVDSGLRYDAASGRLVGRLACP
jgi:branched-chain amino acid transport system substrate-binding protein